MSTKATPGAEVWQTSNLWPMRLGEEKKEERRTKIETTGQNIMACPITQGNHNDHNFSCVRHIHAEFGCEIG